MSSEVATPSSGKVGDFPWPPATAGEVPPIWTGAGFLYQGKRVPVMPYEVDSSNWSEHLTEVHESEAGQNHPMDLASRELAIATMKKLGDSPAVSILDAGCSSGYILEDLRKAMPKVNLIGSDFIRAPLERLAMRVKDLPLLQFDLRKCPLPTESVDGVTCLNVLEHIDDDFAALGQIFRILKKGGLAHIEVPAAPSLYDLYDEYLLHYRRYQMPDLIALARKCGFEVQSSTHLGFLVFPAFWWFKRRNRRFASASNEEKGRIVGDLLKYTKANPLFSTAVRFESVLSRFLKFPFGIRCIVVLRKP